jgi:hypothetical protein
VEEAHKPLLHPSLMDMTKQKSRVGNNSNVIKLLNKKTADVSQNANKLNITVPHMPAQEGMLIEIDYS